MFSVTVFYDERVVIVAEQRPDASEEDSFQWMSRVLQVKPLIIFFQMFYYEAISIRQYVFHTACCYPQTRLHCLVSSVGHRQYPPGWPVLPCACPSQHPPKDSARRHPHLRNQAELSGGKPAPLQYPHVPTHLCYQHAQTTPETAR